MRYARINHRHKDGSDDDGRSIRVHVLGERATTTVSNPNSWNATGSNSTNSATAVYEKLPDHKNTYMVIVVLL